MLSIVVPVYKVEKYLRRCVDSLLKQKVEDCEIILVDDGSPDASGAICDEYALTDERVKVIHKENGGGPSGARNIGVKAATGEYIAFVDSDDWVEADMFSSMLRVMQNENVDFALIRTQAVYENGDKIPEEFELGGKFEVNELNIGKINNRYGSPCNKLYRRKDLVDNDILFPEGLYYEDNAFLWDFETQFPHGYALNQIGYNYFKHQGSITKQKTTPKALDALSIALVIKQNLLKHNLLEQYDAAFAQAFNSYLKLACKRTPRELRAKILPLAQQVLEGVNEEILHKALKPKAYNIMKNIKKGKLSPLIFLKSDIKNLFRRIRQWFN